MLKIDVLLAAAQLLIIIVRVIELIHVFFLRDIRLLIVLLRDHLSRG